MASSMGRAQSVPPKGSAWVLRTASVMLSLAVMSSGAISASHQFLVLLPLLLAKAAR